MSRYTTIRRARPSDSDELTRIAHAAKRHWGYSEQLIRHWEPDLTLRPGFVARQPAYCAVERSRPVAFYALSGRGRCRELEHMWVHPRRIGSGVGTLLFAHLINRLRIMGVTHLRIASDPNAEGFYIRMGARRVGDVASKPAGRALPLLILRVPAGSRSDASPGRHRAA